jgi:hypothetical protein
MLSKLNSFSLDVRNKMKIKLLRLSIGLLLGGSAAYVATGVAASNIPKFNYNQPLLVSVVPVKALEVGTYKDMAARAVVGDNLTPDHIPSFAAIKKFRENQTGGAITGTAETNLRNSTNTIVYSTTIHQQSSRTYGGNNTATQIAADAKDLKAAFIKDRDTIKPKLVASGMSATAVDQAFVKLDSLNKQIGLYQ